MTTKTFYSDEGEVLEMPMQEFCEVFNLTDTERKRLYKPTGWKDSNGTNWCVGKEPKYNITQLSLSNQCIMNSIEQSYIAHYKEGKLEFCEELRLGLKLYNKMFFIWDDHLMTNLMELEEVGEVSFNELWKPWDLRTNSEDKADKLANRRNKYRDEIASM